MTNKTIIQRFMRGVQSGVHLSGITRQKLPVIYVYTGERGDIYIIDNVRKHWRHPLVPLLDGRWLAFTNGVKSCDSRYLGPLGQSKVL